MLVSLISIHRQELAKLDIGALILEKGLRVEETVPFRRHSEERECCANIVPPSWSLILTRAHFTATATTPSRGPSRQGVAW